MWIVDFSKVVKKLDRLPRPIREKLYAWEAKIREVGLREVRRIPGFHDEPLKGQRYGQRSIRLSQSWRAIYQEFPNGEVTIIEIQEVHKHDY